ncbi:magnesium-translocating P-type ATPase [Aquabacterium sp.]|uniref:magnesium-translocating P-type ATPase n=1 Tax=Aquabacterium sp. TaxID=1872578 RepID=UPI002488772D|nr:magnesium-translocating P-type ATPase [Aquabacterium sp.]MDI1350771.1 magnesium-translocating P-type ATPase [Aquabacterium sp.]
MNHDHARANVRANHANAPAPAPAQAQEAAARHALLAVAAQPADAALQTLDSHREGLSAEEAARRLRQHGPNAVGARAEAGMLRQLLRRLANPLNILLLTLSGVSVLSGNVESAVIIFLMVVLSLTLGLVQERRSGRAAAALRAMVHTTASVLRPGQEAQECPIERLVPGDVLHLSAGDLVPADVRVLSARDFFVNEAALTGESVPAEKHGLPETPEAIAADDALGLRNTCFMGTNVASGSATAVVVHTGARAVFGGIAQALTGDRVQTSFEQGINRFTWLMLRFMAVMVPLVFFINGLSKHDWLEALLFATAVAVGLTPEMLPMLVTVNLAKGALTMSRKKVIVKRLDAIQNIGAMDVLCTDKTGTLTQDHIILEKYVDLRGEPSDRVLDFAYLNSHYQSGLKNLLDVAVLKYAEVHDKLHAQGLYQKVDEIPFDFQRRRMSVVLARGDEHLLICKGAVEEVFSVCRRAEVGGELIALDASHLAEVQAASRALNEDGFRVIAIAYKPLPSLSEGAQAEAHAPTVADESDLILLGHIAFLDPPKESAKPALAALAAHGVAVKILTGDNEVVTRKVCRDVGLDASQVMLGHEVEALNDVALRQAVEGTQVFAKLSPGQKARVIEALRAKGHVVGYMGDGINDGPALKAADVGISVDTAVDIAKESADIILLEKSLLVLDEGVIEGRKVFANLLKYIRMGASSNFGNMFSVLGASAWLPFLPMAPIQVLSNNLLYDISQTAIPTDTVDDEELLKPRKWEINHIAGFMLMVGPISSIFDYATYALMYWGFGAQTPAQAALFHTGWFVESLLSQTLIIHIIRTGKIPFLESRASLPLMFTSLSICAVGVWLPYSPLAGFLGLVALPWHYWPWVAGFLLCYLTLTHSVMGWVRRRFSL